MACGGEDGNRNLMKEALAECLTAILSPQQDIRTTAEKQVKTLEITDGAVT